MANNNDVNEFISKIKKLEKGEHLDLSSGEDLSIGIMNLISIEEHLFFSAGKTGDSKYYDMLSDVRKMRVELLREIIKDYGGEEWCISKHLLAASMRLMEVGTKAQTKGDSAKAYAMFQKSYNLYNLFWAINLKLTSAVKSPKPLEDLKKLGPQEKPIDYKKSDLMGKLSGIIGKVLDCCRE